MAGRIRTTKAGVDLIMRFEGFRPRSEALPGGGYVIGFGHTLHARANQKITEEDALTLLTSHDLPPIEKAIIARSLAPLGQNEFDALVSFAFNIGLENFLDSDVFALVNSGAKLNAAEAMAAWRKARVDGRVIVVDALVRRRAAERALFLEVPGGPTPAATPIVQPILDLAAAILHPRDPSESVSSGDAEEPSDALSDEPETDEASAEEAVESPSETAPEMAARNVSERLTRILGEDIHDPDEVAGSESESVAEITRAVSALAEPHDEGGEGQDAEIESAVSASHPQRATPSTRAVIGGEDQPDDPVAAAAINALATQLENEPEQLGEISDSTPEIETETTPWLQTNGAGDELEPLEPIGSVREGDAAPIVDDLEPVTIDDVPPVVDAAASPRAPWGSLVLYGLSAFGGALIGAWGINHLRNAMASETPLASDWALYAGPFAVLVGGLIFLIMGYYFLRAIVSDS